MRGSKLLAVVMGLMAIVTAAGRVSASSPEDELRVSEPLSDLNLFNFFSAGWDQDWAKRHRSTGTPDYALLRVQTNFLEREFRANYFFENNIHSKTKKNISSVDALILERRCVDLEGRTSARAG